MHHPQIVVYESDGVLAGQIGDLARDSRWIVREARHSDACLAFLGEARPAVLLLKLGNKPIGELDLLARLQARCPECPVVLVSDMKSDGAAITGIGYDLGARYVMLPPISRSGLEDVVAGLMAATIRRCFPVSPGSEHA
jgi:DNA-binding response OmpR family regulator